MLVVAKHALKKGPLGIFDGAVDQLRHLVAPFAILDDVNEVIQEVVDVALVVAGAKLGLLELQLAHHRHELVGVV